MRRIIAWLHKQRFSVGCAAILIGAGLLLAFAVVILGNFDETAMLRRRRAGHDRRGSAGGHWQTTGAVRPAGRQVRPQHVVWLKQGVIQNPLVGSG